MKVWHWFRRFSKRTNHFQELIEFVKRINDKKRPDKVPLVYHSISSTIAFVLVGRPEVVYQYGRHPYIAHIRRLVNEGVDRIYVLAKGKYNVRIAEEVIKEVRDWFRTIIRYPPCAKSAHQAMDKVCFCLAAAKPYYYKDVKHNWN